MQIIQETAGPYLHQPIALERRRLLLELGTARRLTGSSGDQSLVETAKTEISRVEKQMRRFSRWLLRRRRAMWLEELEGKQDAFSVCRYARLLAGTGIGSKHRRYRTNSSLHPFSERMGARSGKRRAKGKGLLYTNTLGLTSDESRSFWTLVKAKRLRLIGKRLEPITIAH